MLYDLMAIAADAPATGDNFPVKIVVIVAIIAAIVAGGMAFLSGKNKKQ
ncbi:MAG: hypothetical protein IJ666_02150 [Ruminococcus sp.]|nr:hypothetical protein [Ruminococcus sp.]